MRLPDDAWCRTTVDSRARSRRDKAWDVDRELRALMVDLLAIIAAERKLNKVFDVPRPEWMKPTPSESLQRAVAVIKANARGRVRYVQGATQAP